MIIPTAEYDPMFANDGIPFRAKMIDYIIREFGDTLGASAGLLHSDDGLDAVAAMHIPFATETPTRRRAA